MYVETLLTLSIYLRRAVPVGACTVASGRCGQYEGICVEWHAESGCLQQARSREPRCAPHAADGPGPRAAAELQRRRRAGGRGRGDGARPAGAGRGGGRAARRRPHPRVWPRATAGRRRRPRRRRGAQQRCAAPPPTCHTRVRPSCTRDTDLSEGRIAASEHLFPLPAHRGAQPQCLLAQQARATAALRPTRSPTRAATRATRRARTAPAATMARPRRRARRCCPTACPAMWPWRRAAACAGAPCLRTARRPPAAEELTATTRRRKATTARTATWPRSVAAARWARAAAAPQAAAQTRTPRVRRQAWHQLELACSRLAGR